jgi:hypothetical protein
MTVPAKSYGLKQMPICSGRQNWLMLNSQLQWLRSWPTEHRRVRG